MQHAETNELMMFCRVHYAKSMINKHMSRIQVSIEARLPGSRVSLVSLRPNARLTHTEMPELVLTINSLSEMSGNHHSMVS